MLVERDRNARVIYLSQEVFINSILTRFNLVDATPSLRRWSPALAFPWPIALCLRRRRKKWPLGLTGSWSVASLGLRWELVLVSLSPLCLSRVLGTILVEFTGTIGVERGVAPQEGVIWVSSGG